MIRKPLYALFIASLLFASQAHAVLLSSITSGGALAASTDKLVTVRNGTTDVLTTPAASAITDTTNASNISSGTLPAARVPVGTTLTTAGSVVNTTNAITTLSGTTDAIPSSVAGGTVHFTNSSGDAATLVQATTAGFTSGFGFVANNISTTYATITPTTSTIGGATSLSLAPGHSCYVYSDGTNYQLGLCEATNRIQNVGGGVSGVTQTGQSTSNYICLANVQIPPLGPHDQIRISAYWLRTATTTNTVRVAANLYTAACTPGSNTGIAGTQILATDNSTSGVVSIWTPMLINNTATNAQSLWPIGSGGAFTSSAASASAAIETKAGSYIQFNCRTTASTGDTCGLNWYTVEVIRNP